MPFKAERKNSTIGCNRMAKGHGRTDTNMSLCRIRCYLYRDWPAPRRTITVKQAQTSFHTCFQESQSEGGASLGATLSTAGVFWTKIWKSSGNDLRATPGIYGFSMEFGKHRRSNVHGISRITPPWALSCNFQSW